MIRRVTQSEAVFFAVQSESELQDAIDNGLTETHRLDFKRELELKDEAKKKLAIDIAALAVHGGTLIIGVDEGDKKSPPELNAVELRDLPERVAQIARMRPDPGIAVRTVSVSSEADHNFGYLLIHVPPSPQAPHQVDGRYYGRADKTNYRLSDVEVERLISQRLAQQKDMVAAAREALHGLLFDAPDPPPPIMVLLAEPMGGQADDPLVPLTTLDDAGRRETVLGLVREADVPEHQEGLISFSRNTLQVVRRAGGIAVTNNLTDDGLWNHEWCSELGLDESGAILLTSRRPVMHADSLPSPQIMESLIVGRTELVVRLAPLLSQRHGCGGAWRFGLIVTGTRGGISNALAHVSWFSARDHSPKFNSGVYERATSASVLELTQSPEQVVSRLTSKLLRSLDSYRLPQWSWLPS